MSPHALEAARPSPWQAHGTRSEIQAALVRLMTPPVPSPLGTTPRRRPWDVLAWWRRGRQEELQ